MPFILYLSDLLYHYLYAAAHACCGKVEAALQTGQADCAIGGSGSGALYKASVGGVEADSARCCRAKGIAECVAVHLQSLVVGLYLADACGVGIDVALH